MYSFRSAGGAKFSYSTDFANFDYANISFFDRTGKQIIFHLSLRCKTGLAVVNAKRNGEWQGEMSAPLEQLESGVPVAIAFAGDAISVTLGGRELFQLEGSFAGVETVQYMNFSGGLDAGSFVVDGAANQDREGLGELSLGAGLELRGWAIDPGLPDQNLRLAVDGLKEPIRFRTDKKPEIGSKHGLKDADIGVRATLPGRIWAGAGKGAGKGKGGRDFVMLRLFSNDIPCGEPLRLDKDEVVRRIEATIRGADKGSDTDVGKAMFDLLLALEHAHFANLWPVLSDGARVALRKAGDTYGAEAFLEQADEGLPSDSAAVTGAVSGAVPAPVTISPDEMLMQRARSRFGSRLAATPDPDHLAILEELTDEVPLAPHMVRGLILAVTEPFCSADKFPDLYRFAAMRGLQTFAKSDKNWHNSAILPFLAMEGRLGEVPEVLWSLTHDRSGWIVTPALGWSIRHILKTARGPVAEKPLADIVYAFMSFVDTRGRDYWSRMMCTEMVETVVAMLLESDILSDYLRRDIIGFALRNYGLSRLFWQRLGARAGQTGIEPGTRLALGAKCFGVLQAQAENRGNAVGGGDIEPALAFFEACSNPDVERFRLELLGPTGMRAAGDGALVDDLLLAGRDPEDAVLRSLAFPGAGTVSDSGHGPGLAEIAATGIRIRHANVPKAPYYQLQARCGRETVAFLADLAKNPAKDRSHADSGTRLATLRCLLDMFSTLAGEQSKYLGLGLSLSLFNALLGLDEQELATLALAHLSALRSQITEGSQMHLAEEPAVRAALSALAISAAKTDSALARSALAAFPGFAAGNPATPVQGAVQGTGQAGDPAALLFDTIVVVFSCKPYLGTRIEPMRQGWLARLKALGIPYVVVVGDGDGARKGDVLHLDAPDNYEGLPQKTLKAVEWVHEHTDYGYMLKIDDDCFLNVDEFFYSLSYRKFDYYGRHLHRVVGQMDRTWHFAKSQSARGRMELDKSPEPSQYADGGSGYVLSRRAMRAILRRARSDAGQTLIHCSFMEDKMIGDLLAHSDIQVQEEDYYVAIRRRSHAGGVPVSMWQNSFSASRLAPMKLVHLDSETEQAEAVQLLQGDGLYPRKIWPTWGPVRLGSDTNLLELVSDEARLATLNREPLALVAAVRNEMFMLPHFLAHYRALGVKAFLVADNCSDDGTLEYLLEQPDVAVFSVDTAYGVSQYGVAWQMAVLANLRLGRWSLMADADELLVYPDWERKSLPKLLAEPGFSDVDAVRIHMLDMYPKGPLSDADFEDGGPFGGAGYVDGAPFLRNSTGRGAFSNSPTITSALRHRLLPGSRPELFVAQKYALLKYKPWMRPSAGLHYVADIGVAQTEMIFAHFKYNAHFRAKAQAEVARGQHFNNAEEYRKYLALVSEGREVVYDAHVSVPWRDCGEVKRILGG